MLMPLSVLMGLLCINIGVQSMSEPTELAIEEDSGTTVSWSKPKGTPIAS